MLANKIAWPGSYSCSAMAVWGDFFSDSYCADLRCLVV